MGCATQMQVNKMHVKFYLEYITGTGEWHERPAVVGGQFERLYGCGPVAQLCDDRNEPSSSTKTVY